MDRRTFIKHCQLLGLPLLPGAASTFLLNNVAAASTESPLPTIRDSSIPIFRINIIGAGGLGTRLVSRIAKTQYSYDPAEVSIRYFAVDTDRHSLDKLETGLVRPVWIPAESGAGGASIDPSTARRLATFHGDRLFGTPKISDRDPQASGELNLAGAPMTIIVAGFGRGAGTGLTQEIARKSLEAGALTMAFVTEPLSFESTSSPLETKLKTLASTATVVRVCHDESQPEALLKDVLSHAESELVRRVRNLLDAVTTPGLIGLDFEDVRSVFSKPGMSGYGSGRSLVAYSTNGPLPYDGYPCDAALDALAMLPDIGTAKSAFVIFSINNAFKLGQIRDCMLPIRARLSEDATIMTVASFDSSLAAGHFGLDIWVPNYQS